MALSDADFEAVRGMLHELRVSREATPGGRAPAPEVEWPILVTFAEPVDSARCFERFDESWQSDHDTLLYALPAAGGWKLAERGEAQAYHALQIAVRLPGDAAPRSRARLERLQAEIAARAGQLGALLTEARYPLESAVERAAELGSLRDLIEERDDGCVHVRVQSPGAAAERVEGVLEALGFAPRRGGLWAFGNERGCLGGDPIIGASFDPAAGLSLWFAVPRVAAPFAVLDALVAVAALVVGSVGGKIVDDAGAPVDARSLHAAVEDMVERMARANLIPGDTALSLV